MCFWGYYTPNSVISDAVVRKCNVHKEMLPFWKELFHQVSLEYVYVNHIKYKNVHIALGTEESVPLAHLPSPTSGGMHSVLELAK